MSRDRTVHACYPGMDIVRYDRAGKWYLEPANPNLKRQAVSLMGAVAQAVWALNNGGNVFWRLPGGNAFDRAVKRSLEES